jgi:pyruvate,orthophosphate dikinase
VDAADPGRQAHRAAAFRIACQLVDEGLIDLDEALRRVSGEQLAQLMFPHFASTAGAERIARGIGASPGRRSGGRLRLRHRGGAGRRGEQVVLVRRETTPTTCTA